MEDSRKSSEDKKITQNTEVKVDNLTKGSLNSQEPEKISEQQKESKKLELVSEQQEKTMNEINEKVENMVDKVFERMREQVNNGNYELVKKMLKVSKKIPNNLDMTDNPDAVFSSKEYKGRDEVAQHIAEDIFPQLEQIKNQFGLFKEPNNEIISNSLQTLNDNSVPMLFTFIPPLKENLDFDKELNSYFNR